MKMSEMLRRRWIPAFAFLFVLFSAAGLYFHQQREAEPVVLRVGLFAGSNWDVPAGNSYAVMDEAIRRFEETHENVKVDYVSGIQKADYSEWLAEELIKGEEPDVFFILSEDFNLYASMGGLMDLGPWMEQDADLELGCYYPTALDYGIYEDMQAALPVECNPTLMFVNKTLLEKEGIPVPDNDWTWTDFLKICRQVTKDADGDGVLDQFGCYDFSWRKAAAANDVRLFREDGRASYFADSRMEETVRFMMDLRAIERGREVTAKDFDTGRVAFRPFTFAEYRTYKPYPWKIKKYSSFEWDCIKLPAGPSGRNTTVLGVLLAGISARTSQPELAWEFLKQICYDYQQQQVVLAESQGLPPRRDVMESKEAELLFAQDVLGQGKMDVSTVSDVMDDSVSAPKFQGYEAAMLLADNEIRKILNGSIPFHNALNKLQKEVNVYLQY